MRKHLLYTGFHLHDLEKALQKFVGLVLYIPSTRWETEAVEAEGLHNWPAAQPVVTVQMPS